MTNIKTSRKGLRLNDARYFRLPLPHMRKRMTIMRITPRISNSQSDRFHVIQHSASVNPGFRIGTKLPERSKTVESKQSSAEIALVTCRDFEDIDQNKKGCQDICVETEVIEPPGNLPSSTEQEDVPALRLNDSKKSAKFPQVDDIRRKTVRKMVLNEKLRGQVERSCKNVDRKQNCGDRIVEAEKKEKGSSWWKDGGQTVLHFFAKILGKRGETGTKGPTDHVLPIGKQSRKRVKRVSRDGQGHNRRKRDVDGSIRLKRVNNGYIACRDEEIARHGAVTKNKSREEQHHPSIFVRQIQRTRDKGLRVMLLERELRLRSPKTAKRDAHLTANGVVSIRRLSNPLC